MRRLTVVGATVLAIAVAMFLVSRADRPDVDPATRTTATLALDASASSPRLGIGDQAAPPGRKPGPPPRFAPTPSAGVERDPSSPDYDPVQLVRLDEPVDAVFSAEPRSEAWATPVEKMFADFLPAHVQRFSGRAQVVLIECRTSSCVIGVDAPVDEAARVNLALQIPPLGNLMQPSVSEDAAQAGRRRFRIHVLFAKEKRDVDDLARRHKYEVDKFEQGLRRDPAAAARLGVAPLAR